MSSPEYEDFGMTENDVLDAMDPLRRQRRRTKEESIYGMWADSDDDDESAGRRGLGAGKSGGKADYSRPVNFVSGGLKKTQAEIDAEEKEGSNDAEERPPAPRPAKESRFSGLGGVKKVGGAAGATDVGDFEKYTKGIGKRLLSKMGWKSGEGLGKNKQGIAKPVEAYVRKGKGALGFYGSERVEPVAPVQKEPKASGKKGGEAASAAPKLGQWKKAPGEKKVKVQYVVRSTADIAADGDYRNQRGGGRSQLQDSALTSVKVIDLTGKEKVVYSGYSALSRHHVLPGEDLIDLTGEDGPRATYFDVPELRHNLRLLVNSAEEDVIENLKVRDRETDQIACLAHDKQRLEDVIEEEDRQIQQLQKIVELVNRVDTIKNLDEAIGLLNELESGFDTEFKMYGLDRLLLPVAEPLLKAELQDWDPLERSQATKGHESLRRLRQAFTEAEEQSASGVGIAQYDSLIWEVVVPPIRQAIISRWNPRDPETLVSFFEKWQSILPSWSWENLCDQCLVPRILTEAENWNPVADTLPIHSWVHPWLGLLGEKLEPVYIPIRQKIGAALTNWHPSDPSARILLSAWLRVWSEGQMRSFLLQNIGPKLTKVMQDFVVNPIQQQMDPWKWVFDWLDMIPSPFFVQLLEKWFFPKWLQCLASWLDSNSADYQEVMKWYLGWKNSIPAAIADEPNIKEHLGKALVMMNTVMSGGRAESVLLGAPSTSYGAPPPQPLYIPPPPPPPQAAISFKELIQRRAEATGLLFMPMQRSGGHQQMYQLGRAVLYIDRNVAFVSAGGSWRPVSLEELFSLA